MSDDEFLLWFERAEFTAEQWHHREHLKVAYLYLLRLPYDAALDRMRVGLKALNGAQDVPETPDRGYHETLTQAWLRLVHSTLCEFGPAASADAFLDEHTHLLSKRALRFFYSRDRIVSWEAKANFVEPDLAPLPCSAKSFQPGSKASP